jgi:hypothetical protein
VDLEEHEQVIHSFVVPDLEFGSLMATELKKVDSIEAEIAKLNNKLNVMKAQAHYIGGTVWQNFFDKYPNNHPTDFKGKGVNSVRFDTDSHTVFLIRNTKL